MRKSNYELRRKLILNELKKNRLLPIGKLAEFLDVSGETVRQDLISLENEGLVNRYHGSVVLVPDSEDSKEISLQERKKIFTTVKMRIAEEVYKHLPKERNAVIGLDVGNTVWHLAKLLKEREDRTIVTNSQEIVELYANDPNNEVYCTGGLLRTFDNGFYGPWTIHSIQSTSIAAVVLSSGGVKNWQGLGGISFEDGDAKRAYVKNSAFTIAMLDSSKFSQCSLVEAVPWSDIDLLVTDSGLSDVDRERISQQVELIVVPVD
jgi:DeoR/GlpR family transcriptional regulator of sugar metabolism